MQKTLIKLRIKCLKYYYGFRYGGLVRLLSSAARKLRMWPLNKQRAAALGCLVIVCVLGLSWLIEPSVKAKTLNLGAQDFAGGYTDYNQVQLGAGSSSLSLQRGDLGSWSGSDGMPLPPSPAYGDVNLVYGPNNTLYEMAPMSNTCHFDRYSFDTRAWQSLQEPPIGCASSNGTSLVFDGTGSMYYLPANNAPDLFRYDIATNSWTHLSDSPSGTGIGTGASMTYVSSGNNSALYVMRGGSSTSFYRYTIKTDSWSTMAPFPTTGQVNAGIRVAADSNGNNIYAISSYYGEFKKYSVASNTWSNLPSYSVGNNVKYNINWVNGKLYLVQQATCCTRSTGLAVYDPTANSWTKLAQTPEDLYDGYYPALANDGSNTLYAVFGYSQHPILYSYDISSNSWQSPSLFVQDGTHSHWSLMYDGTQSAYYVGGVGSGNMDRVYKIDLATNAVTQVGTQINTRGGYTGIYYNGSLYTMPYPTSTQFMKYDTVTNQWSQLADLPTTANWGAHFIDGGDGYLYAVFGNNSNAFYRYSDAGGWVQLANLPGGVAGGAGMARVGTNIYVLRGNSTGSFYKYSMSGGTWSTLAEVPNGGVSYGGFLTGDDTRYLYADLGNRDDPNDKQMYQYDTITSSWRRIADLPANTQLGADAFYDKTHNKLYVTQGGTYSHIWSWSPTATNYVTSGSWLSKTLDMGNVQSWQNVALSSTGTGTTTVYTRSSPNANIWSDWQQASGGSISSPPNRYLQIKIVMSSDGTSSPIITGVAVNYGEDTIAPNLPSQFTAVDKPGGTALVSGQTYVYQHPYFSWNGADDGTSGSGVAGYYVYFGTDSNADPVTDGNYQTGNSYMVSTAMTAGDVYYVRIKVKDNAGNVSDAATYFSYRYWYISPPGSIMQSSQADFSQGTNSGVSIASDGTMSLVQQPSGAWATGTMQMMPNASTSGPAITVAGDYVYILRGSGSGDFWRYNLISQTWDILPNYPVNVNNGSGMTWDQGNFIYVMTGNTTNTFYRYNIQNNAWEVLPALPVYAQAGSVMSYIGNNKVAFIFTGVAELDVYNATSGTFSSMASPLNVTSGNAGSGLWWDGNDTLYEYAGPYDQWQGNRRSLSAYTISQDAWHPLPAQPIDPWYGQAALAGDGHGHLYVFGNNETNNVSPNSMAEKYDIASGTWTVLKNYNVQNDRGAVASDGDRYIYIIPTLNTTRKIVRYDTWNNKFTPEGPAVNSWHEVPYDVGSSWTWRADTATSAVYDGNGNIYALSAGEGSGGSKFIRQTIDGVGSTTYLPPPPLVGQNGGLAILNGILYYLPGQNTNYFYKFDGNTRMWVRLSNLPVNSYRGAQGGLVALPNGTLLAIVGNGVQTYKFTPDSGSGSWTRMADAPGSIYQGSAAYDGSHTIYAMASNNTKNFYAYDTTANTWRRLSALPVNALSGTAMMYSNGKVYASVGNNSTAIYVYDVASDSWSAGPSAPDIFKAGAVMLPINSQYALVITGQSSPAIWRFDFPSATTAYQGVATYISQPFSVDGLFDYAGIQAQASTPADTGVEFYTRTSVDGTNWDSWSLADQTKQYGSSLSVHVTSRPQKYTQVKIVLYSYDNEYTPTLHNYSLDYYFDTTPPSDPTVLDVYQDSSRTSEFTNNTWYNNPSPIFDWPDPGQAGGGTDGPLGSNLKGYYVYVGTDPTAVPQTAGVFVTNTEYIPTLKTPGKYYFRLQAVDMTGNVDSNIFSPFIYKFDNVPPTNPSLITATPSGFTGKNNYTFQWPNGFDADSGIDQYCYHTGALTGPLAVETCQSNLDLTNLAAAYQSGTNVLYLRTRDIAGNYSPSYTQVSYYYSTDPPSPVTNLRAVPPTSSQNLFAFIWDYPTLFSGDPNQLTYCYAINELPTPTNTTCTQDMFISAFKAATQQGTNTLYMVAKDEAGNVNWNNYASANFIANTVSPGIPLNLVVNDTSDSVTGRWSLTLTWDPPTFAGNGIADYVIERSIDDHTFTTLGRGTNTAYVDLTVDPGTTYYYRVRAADNVDNEGGASAIVAQSAKGSFASPPKIVSDPKPGPSFDQANISWVTDRASTSFVYYGTSPTQLTQSKGTLDLLTEHAVDITGLQPNTIYYYKVQSFDNNRSYDLATAYSQLYTFRTAEAARIFNVQTSDITLDSAIVNWQTSVPTQARITYGPTTDYGLSQDDASGFTASHIFKLTNLASGTTYHFRIVATTSYGSIINSDDYTLTTIARPRVNNIAFQPISSANTIAVHVTWTTNVPTSSDITYTGLGSKKDTGDGTLVTKHDMVIDDLASNTDYNFNIQGRDQYGNQAISDLQKWHTGVDTKAPTISNFSVDAGTMQTAGGQAKAQLIITWHTDEPATTQVQYGGSTGKLNKKSPFDPQPTVDHVVVLSGLDLAQVYRVQPISRDISNNAGYGAQVATVTPDIEQSPLDIVINTLQKIFRL